MFHCINTIFSIYNLYIYIYISFKNKFLLVLINRQSFISYHMIASSSSSPLGSIHSVALNNEPEYNHIYNYVPFSKINHNCDLLHSDNN